MFEGTIYVAKDTKGLNLYYSSTSDGCRSTFTAPREQGVPELGGQHWVATVARHITRWLDGRFLDGRGGGRRRLGWDGTGRALFHLI